MVVGDNFRDLQPSDLTDGGFGLYGAWNDNDNSNYNNNSNHDMITINGPIPMSTPMDLMATVEQQQSCYSMQDVASNDIHDAAGKIAQDVRYSVFGYDNLNPTCDVLMTFRNQHRFLDGVYNSYQNPHDVSAKELVKISQRVGLSMEEVLFWFDDETVRRTKLLASRPYQRQPCSHEVPPSPMGTTSPGPNSTITLSTTQFKSNSLEPILQLQLSPSPGLSPPRFPVSVKGKRGRPTRHQPSTTADLLSPELKRQKISIEYLCPDCSKSFAAERWSEHVKRVHFPDSIWACQKTIGKTGKICGSNPFFRPDNFGTHLKGEHGSSDEEISQLKAAFKFRVRKFFHHICGICEDFLENRDESIEHIKSHFREIALRPNPPQDLGASEWKEKCGSKHKLTRGVHYKFVESENGNVPNRSHDRDDGSGPSQGKLYNHSHDNASHHPDQRPSQDGDGSSADDSGFYSSQNSSHVAFRKQLASLLHGLAVSAHDNGQSSSENGRCRAPNCGKVFKDLKAHMLTHQVERPHKCPIVTCDYHTKGFARKYDQNRHTITHYKGSMVCGFCPSSSSSAEKSFNRADVFKRHLISVHAVEQTQPNSRKRISGGVKVGKKLVGSPDVTGKCSTCSVMFKNVQDFYEHLDDCVLLILQQENPSEAINARRLAEVENDPAMHNNLRSNIFPTSTITYLSGEDDDEEEDFEDANKDAYEKEDDDDDDDDYEACGSKSLRFGAFDVFRRLWKDNNMPSTNDKFRISLSDDNSNVIDLDTSTSTEEGRDLSTCIKESEIIT